MNWQDLKQKNEINISDDVYQYVVAIEQTIETLEEKIYISARCLKQIIDLAKGWAVIHEKIMLLIKILKIHFHIF